MPKMKTNRAAAKRFIKTGAGGVKRAKAYKSHILTKKDAKRKRSLRGTFVVDRAEMNKVKRLLPGT